MLKPPKVPKHSEKMWRKPNRIKGHSHNGLYLSFQQDVHYKIEWVEIIDGRGLGKFSWTFLKRAWNDWVHVIKKKQKYNISTHG